MVSMFSPLFTIPYMSYGLNSLDGGSFWGGYMGSIIGISKGMLGGLDNGSHGVWGLGFRVKAPGSHVLRALCRHVLLGSLSRLHLAAFKLSC